MTYPAVDLNTIYMRLKGTWTSPLLYWMSVGKHMLCIVNKAAWTVFFLSQANRSSSSQSHCFLLCFAFPLIGSLLSCSACWSRLGPCLKLNRCQSPVDSRSLWINASYLLLWYDGKYMEGKWGLLLDQAVRESVYWTVRHLLTKVFPYI